MDETDLLIVAARALHWLAQALAEPEQDATQQDGSFVFTVYEVIAEIYMTWVYGCFQK